MKRTSAGAKTATKQVLKRVLGCIGPYWIFLALSLALAAASVGTQLLVPILTGEAIDVMLELSAAQPESFYAVDQHILLRFSLGEPSFKQFVIVSGSDPPPEHEIRQDEKIIVLLPDDIRPETFPYTRPVIFAIRQENGTHRFFARK